MADVTPEAAGTEAYGVHLDTKVARRTGALRELGAPVPEVYPSPSSHYRMRAEFRVWHDGDDLYYAMFEPGNPRDPIRIDTFPAADTRIDTLMRELRPALRSNPVLRHKLFQAEFHCTLTGDAMVTLAYHRPLDDDWLRAAQALGQQLSCSIIGRARRQKHTIGRDWVEETLHVEGQPYHYRQYEQAFSQPNARVNQAMIAWAMDQARAAPPGDDLLELYCGNGNFSVPLAGCYRHVLATEVSKTGLHAARHNARWNGRNNLLLARLSAEEMASALRGDRIFRRLAELDPPLGSLRLRHLFVDPPRAGLDPVTLALLPRFERVIYISCNPDTLARDARAVGDVFRIAAFAVFDQFPFTDHLECGIVLERHQPQETHSDEPA